MASSIIYFANELLPPDSVSLGDLVLDIDAPWDNYCPQTAVVNDKDIRIAAQPQLYGIIEDGLNNGGDIDVGFIKRTKHIYTF